MLLLFSFNHPPTTEIYTLSLHDALPISRAPRPGRGSAAPSPACSSTRAPRPPRSPRAARPERSEEHTSELQSHSDLVCRLLLEKKKKKTTSQHRSTTADKADHNE